MYIKYIDYKYNIVLKWILVNTIQRKKKNIERKNKILLANYIYCT